MILTFKLRHNKDVRLLLRLAFDVAVFTVKNKIKSPNTTFVKDVRSDLPSAIACQVMKKYGRQKTIKNDQIKGSRVRSFKTREWREDKSFANKSNFSIELASIISKSWASRIPGNRLTV